jgi:hypothetical protein
LFVVHIQIGDGSIERRTSDSVDDTNGVVLGVTHGDSLHESIVTTYGVEDPALLLCAPLASDGEQAELGGELLVEHEVDHLALLRREMRAYMT